MTAPAPAASAPPAQLKLKEKELSQKKKDFKKSLGLHSNFKNLKPHYDELKYGRAKDLANYWLK